MEAAATPPVQRTLKYARDVQTEMRKVVWPTRQQLVAYTLALVGTVVLGALFLYVCDLVFHFGLNLLIG